MKKTEILKELNERKNVSAWNKGVNEYAIELLESVEDEELNKEDLEKTLLDGASSWNEYSWSGCSLIYNEDIAERLCNNTELKRTKHGENRPNRNEEWLDTQTRALFQAFLRIRKIVK